jgi:hypothetical protein
MLYNGGNCSIFAQGDNFTILTAGLIMPLSFQLDRSINVSYDPVLTITIEAVGGTSGLRYGFKELFYGGFNSFYLPVENYDTPFDLYIDVTNQPPNGTHYLINEASFQLSMLLITIPPIAISMAGVPASLQGTFQYITPYLKILHNLPLTS